jgi:hypothetical protein
VSEPIRILRFTAHLNGGALQCLFEHEPPTPEVPWEMHREALMLAHLRLAQTIALGPMACPRGPGADKSDSEPRRGPVGFVQLSSLESEDEHGPQD